MLRINFKVEQSLSQSIFSVMLSIKQRKVHLVTKEKLASLIKYKISHIRTQ